MKGVFLFQDTIWIKKFAPCANANVCMPKFSIGLSSCALKWYNPPAHLLYVNLVLILRIYEQCKTFQVSGSSSLLNVYVVLSRTCLDIFWEMKAPSLEFHFFWYFSLRNGKRVREEDQAIK